MGFGWDDIQRIVDDVRDAAKDFQEQIEEATGLDRLFEQADEAFGMDTRSFLLLLNSSSITDRQAGDVALRSDDYRAAAMLALRSLRELVDEYTPENAYRGDNYDPRRRGFPTQLNYEIRSDASGPLDDIAFLGHAPVCMFDQMFMTQTGPVLVDDQEESRFVSARLMQLDEAGRRLFVSGIEVSYQEDGEIAREDLQLPARSPLTAYMSFGGPIEEGLPLFLVVNRVGDWSTIPDVEQYKIQVSVNLFCKTTT